MYLLDANICIYIINKRPVTVVEKIKTSEPNQIKVSAISVAELPYGIAKSSYREKKRAALIDFVSGSDILPFGDADAEVFGVIRADLEKRGKLIGTCDKEIAAQAIARNLTLVNNSYLNLNELQNQKKENWAIL
jgi:tRNA(fMet)-specific endonuclease VapC